MPMKAALLEWLITNHHGSFSMGNVDRVPRRKYHGLWISRAMNQKNPEHLLLDVIERCVQRDSNIKALANYDFGQGAGEDARSLIQDFQLKPYPRWVYDLGIGKLVRSLRWLSPEDSPSCLEGIELEYSWEESASDIELTLEPVFTLREFHSLAFQNITLDGSINRLENGTGFYRFQPYQDLDEILVQLTGDHRIEIQGAWYKNFYYSEEKERGYPAYEDGFCPFRFSVKVPVKSPVKLRFMIGLKQSTHMRRNSKSIQVLGKYSDFYHDLSHSLNSFVYSTPKKLERENIIAGFPWFSCWARDTLVSLPGLSLSWNDSERALYLLKSWVPILERQMFGTGIADVEEDLNATGLDSPWLWGAALRFLIEQHPKKVTQDYPLARELMLDLERWILSFFNGECLIAQVTSFGLFCKPGNYASGWMDAIVDGIPITPRIGYPVEINSLFFDSIHFLLQFHNEMEKSVAQIFKDYLNSIQRDFSRHFWIEGRGFVADGHDGLRQDQTLRPNQIWALAGGFELFPIKNARSALLKVTEELLTPVGLRTRAPLDSLYRGYYCGNQAERDRAYHQGTVWPWLIGKYTEAALRCWGGKQTQKIVEPVLNSLKHHFYETACLHNISEIFDGDSPHAPRGAPAQAWSVAEVLRTIWLIENAIY